MTDRGAEAPRLKKDQEEERQVTRVDSPSESAHGDPTRGRESLVSASVSDHQVSNQVTRALLQLVRGIRMLRVLPREDADANALNRAYAEAASYVESFVGREIHLVGHPCKACGGVGRRQYAKEVTDGCDECNGEGAVLDAVVESRGVCSTCGPVGIVWIGHPVCGECRGSKVLVDSTRKRT